MASSFTTHAPIDIRVNTAITDVDTVSERLMSIGVEHERTPLAPHGLRLEAYTDLSDVEKLGLI